MVFDDGICSGGELGHQGQHEFGKPMEDEERGVLVITHGKRVGRIYATEHTWTQRTCSECGYVQHNNKTNHSNEWPSTV